MVVFLFLFMYNNFKEEGTEMLDIKFIRENPDKVKDNIKKKFQDKKLVLVDEVIELDKDIRSLKVSGDELRKKRNDISD